MNYFSKIKLGTWLVIILTAINIGALSTIIYKNQCRPDKPDFRPQGNMNPKNGFSYFVKEMELDSSQVNYFNQSRFEFFNKSRDLYSKQEKLRFRIITELSNNDPDTVLLYSLCDSMGYNYTQIKKLTMNNFVGFRKMCNLKQKRKLDTIYNRLIRPEGPVRNHGKGPNNPPPQPPHEGN